MISCTCLPPRVFMVLEDGTQLELPVESITLAETPCPTLYADESPTYIAPPSTFSLEVSRPKPVSKKRFIKLLMSRGLQRNMAQGVAEYIKAIGQPYDAYSLLFVPGLTYGKR